MAVSSRFRLLRIELAANQEKEASTARRNHATRADAQVSLRRMCHAVTAQLEDRNIQAW